MKAITITLALTALISANAYAQNLSDFLGDKLKQEVRTSLNAELSYETFEVNTLTADLSARDIVLKTDIAELDEGLNTPLIANEIYLQGDWMSAAKNRLQIDYAEINDAQITIAYYDTGKSNIHAMAEQLQKLKLQPVSKPLHWQVDEVVLNNITINLFDKGEPIYSVRLSEYRLPQMAADQDPTWLIAELMTDIATMIARQTLFGSGDGEEVVLHLDRPKFMAFLQREAGAFL